jgi:hypothetical protein
MLKLPSQLLHQVEQPMSAHRTLQMVAVIRTTHRYGRLAHFCIVCNIAAAHHQANRCARSHQAMRPLRVALSPAEEAMF